MPEIEILTAQRAVTAAGTPEQIKEAPESRENKVIAIQIRANTGNTGNIYVTRKLQRATASTTGGILAAGEVMTLDVHDFLDGWLDLAKIWIDSDVNGDGVSYVAFEVIR